jgi:CheY-like chemotaxis protein
MGTELTEHERAWPLVVIIEDEPEVLTTLTRQLHHLLPQAVIVAAQDGTSALAQIADQTVDLAVVDYYLPGQSGLAIITALKRHSPYVHTILTTASPTLDVEQAARLAGVDVILPKPFLLEELDHVIHNLLPDALEGR